MMRGSEPDPWERSRTIASLAFDVTFPPRALKSNGLYDEFAFILFLKKIRILHFDLHPLQVLFTLPLQPYSNANMSATSNAPVSATVAPSACEPTLFSGVFRSLTSVATVTSSNQTTPVAALIGGVVRHVFQDVKDSVADVVSQRFLKSSVADFGFGPIRQSLNPTLPQRPSLASWFEGTAAESTAPVAVETSTDEFVNVIMIAMG